MTIDLVVLDHHTARVQDLPASVFLSKTPDEGAFYDLCQDYLLEEYDLVLADQDPDGSMAAALYLLGTGESPRLASMRGDLTAAKLAEYEQQGIKRILALDWYSVYTSDLGAASVTVLNPVISGMPHTVCATQMVYEALFPFAEEESALALAAMGIVSDYGTESALPLFREIARLHPKHFGDLADLVSRGTLDRYTAFDTRLKDLSEMAWAPYILQGDQGAEEMVRVLVQNPGYSVAGFLRGSRNPAVKFLRSQWAEFTALLREERQHFERTARFDAPLIIYQPKSPLKGLVQKFSSILADEHADSVVLVKTPLDGKWKYSLRRRNLELDLGAIVKEMGVGGGIPPAAGCTTDNPEGFEQEFGERVRKEKR